MYDQWTSNIAIANSINPAFPSNRSNCTRRPTPRWTPALIGVRDPPHALCPTPLPCSYLAFRP